MKKNNQSNDYPKNIPISIEIEKFTGESDKIYKTNLQTKNPGPHSGKTVWMLENGQLIVFSEICCARTMNGGYCKNSSSTIRNDNGKSYCATHAHWLLKDD